MARSWSARLLADCRSRLAARAAVPGEPPPPVPVVTDVGTLLFQGHDRLMVPLIAAQHGRWEAAESDQLRALLRPGMTFLDVGAHVGYMTLLGARAVGPTGRVIAVEASPANVALLRHNLRANGATNVEVIAAAASDRSGIVSLSLSPWNTGDNRAYAVPDMATVEVRAVRLDDVLAPDGQIDVVKLDTQGTDHRAVAGLSATIARCRPVLVVEFWPLGISESGDDPLAVIEQYTAMGLEVRVLGESEDGPLPSSEQVVDGARARHGELCTLVLRPAETQHPTA